MPMPSTQIPTLDMLAEDYFAYLQSERRASADTLRSYRSDWRLFRATLPADAPLGAFTVHAIRAWIATQTRWAAATYGRRIGTLRSFGTWAIHEGYLSTSPAHRIARPHGANALPRIFTDADVRRLLETVATATDRRARRDQAVLEVLASTMLRRSEVVGLNVGDVSLTGRWIQVRHGKGNKTRMVPIGPRVVAAMSAVLDPAAPTDAPMFVNGRGRRLQPAAVAQIVKARGRAAGLTGRLHAHAFRHYGITALRARGADLHDVQVLAGHASIVTTQRYDHVTTDRLVASAARHPLFAE